MNKLIASLLLSLATVGLAQAAGDPLAGQANTAVCAACHGPDGNSLVPTFAKLAGQGERYLNKQLHDIKSGRRPVVEMTGMLESLSDQQLSDIAAWYASQASTSAQADPALAAAGEALYRGGRLDTGLPACSGCHGPDGLGLAVAGFPHLRGQHAPYTARQLRDFRDGKRTNDGDSRIMRTVAGRLDDQDIEALAAYLQGLP